MGLRFSRRDGLYSQTLVDGRLYVSSNAGYVYSLDADTGCVHWAFRSQSVVRSGFTVGRMSRTSDRLMHVLKNTGAAPIRTNVYNHNFMTIDKQPPGPDYEIAFPFEVQRAQRGAQGGGGGGAATRGARPGGQGGAAGPGAAGGQGGPGAGRGLNPPNGSQCGRPEMQALAAAQGNRLVYAKTLEGRECFQAGFIGFGAAAADHDIRIENKKVGAGVRITGDRPLLRVGYWSIRTVLAPEPYIDIAVEPGQEFTWKWTYDYFVTK